MNKSLEFYHFAYNYLLEVTPDYITRDVINSYLRYDSPENNVSSLNDVYLRLLTSAQSQNCNSNVIGGAIGGIENLSKVLNNFDIKYVINTYSGKEDLLLDIIEKELKPKGKIKRNKKSLWPKYCKTIISVAEFLNQFNDEKELINWLNMYYADPKSICVLPLLISIENYGFGFALACDFLKDLGYVKFGKPDVHIKDILLTYKFINKTDSDYVVLKKMMQISKEANITCFEFDRILWLIGSGNFYNHKNYGKINRLKKDFIRKVDIFYNSIS